MDQRLYDAARIGDIDALDALLSADPLILNKVCLSHFAETPLHVAILAGQTEFAKEIIRLMPSFVRELNRDGFAPMHAASARGDKDILMELLKLDEDRSLCLQKDSSGQIPLHYAVVRGRIPVIEMLTSHCVESMQEETALGETVLHLAVKNSQFGALKVILERLKGLECFEKLLNTKDYQGKGKTMVELAQAKKQVQVLEVLKEYQKGHTDNDTSSPGHDEITEVDQHPIDISGPETDADNKQEPSEEEKEKPRQIEKTSDPVTDNKEKAGQVELANLVLTAAVLIATETYQAGFGPPSALLKKYEINPSCKFTFMDFLNSFINEKETLRHCPAYYFYFFMVFNTAGFLFSGVLILVVTLQYTSKYPAVRLLVLSISFLLLNYIACLRAVLEKHSKSELVIYAVSWAIVLVLPVCVYAWSWCFGSMIKLPQKYVNKCKSWQKEMKKKRDQWHAKICGFPGK